MRCLSFLFLLCILLIGCKKEPNGGFDYCKEAYDEFKQLRFEGTINICNAQPPLMAFIPGVATTTFVDSNTFEVHLVADSLNFDTTLIFKLKCDLAEKVIPIITVTDENGVEKGGYNESIKHLLFRFGYPNCLDNTAFEGIGI